MFNNFCEIQDFDSNINLKNNVLADHVPRETLFHFASRLGLSTFVTLLLEKPGAELCLQLCNKHGELATDIAKSREFDGLADLMTEYDCIIFFYVILFKLNWFCIEKLFNMSINIIKF